ncbi:hypothetical protein GN958_ATG14036, partial [Phytophthora infestans]
RIQPRDVSRTRALRSKRRFLWLLSCSHAVDEDHRSTRYELSFRHYCVSLSTLVQFGSPAQQFQYLFHTYAATSERGIDRQEIFQLLQDHSERVNMKNDKLSHVTDPRHFDKLYTWLKKHFIAFDEARCGFLQENAALDMLQAYPTALTHLKFQLAPFIKTIKENGTRYADQAAATQLPD